MSSHNARHNQTQHSERADLVAMQALRDEVESAVLPESLGDFVRERAKLFGDRSAAEWFESSETLSYKQLDAQSDCLASSLQHLGVRKGSHVAVLMPNVPAFLITWVALGKIGAVIVPVNVAYTAPEILFVLEDSDSQFIVLDESCRTAFDTLAKRPALLPDHRVIVHGAVDARSFVMWSDLISCRSDYVNPAPVARTDLLNIQYTSGSTGFPKGCMLTHDYWMIISKVMATARRAEKSQHRVLIWAPFHYMDPMWQFLVTLHLGGTAYIAKRMSLTSFLNWLQEYRIDTCWSFPEALLKQVPMSPSDRTLELGYTSLAAWRGDARKLVEERFEVVARENFGMTEIGMGTIVPREAGDYAFERTCGLPAPFRELRIVDSNGDDVQDGQAGELWVTGRGILWGYYKRPDANAQAFVGKWLRTGDMFRKEPSGYYYVVGRIKEMIKRSGENIAALEIEAVLRSMEEIQEAAVVAVPDALRGEEVKVYLKLRDGLTADQVPPSAVTDFCASRLAKFKWPRYIAYVDDFPRTPSRKIAKPRLTAESADLRLNSYDVQEELWR